MASNTESNGVKGASGTISSGSSELEGCSKQITMAMEDDDDKKRRRMESNRESARRSRQKKQQHLDDLIKQVGALTRDNAEIQKKMKHVSGLLATYDAQNKLLHAHKDRLAARLDSLQSIIDIAKLVKGPSSSSSSSTNNNNSYLGELLYVYNHNNTDTNTNTNTNDDDGNNNGGDPSSSLMMKPWQFPCPIPTSMSPLIPYSSPSSFHF